MTKRRGYGIAIPRELLLVDIERRCADPRCGVKTRVGLTKAEAHHYTGFACERCERWHDDTLAERDIPEWWEELFVANPGAGGVASTSAALDTVEPDEFVLRLSEEWRSARGLESSEAPDDGERESIE